MPSPYLHSGDYITPSLCERGDTVRFTSPNGPVDYTVVDVIRDDEARGVITLRLAPLAPGVVACKLCGSVLHKYDSCPEHSDG